MTSSPKSNSSRASTPSSSPIALPAKRSVQALLAELSDSDSDAVTQPTKEALKPSRVENDANESAESSDNDVLVGGGRLAARLAAEVPRHSALEGAEGLSTSTSGLTEADDPTQSYTSPISEQDEEGDEAFKPKRRMLLKRKRTSNDDGNVGSSPRQDRPAAVRNSPASTRAISPTIAVQPESPKEKEDQASTGKSKFTLLVEKARKDRLAREEAEKAKKAARQAQESVGPSPKRRGQRGSSPADDSEEDSDQSEAAPAKRFTKDARPTRKASKKALEEMNRETQRMNRNMQLAHQARTKKKFTKESFLASFGRGPPTVSETNEVATEIRPASSSSLPSSDAENPQLNSTPPTSPLLEPDHSKTAIPTAVAPIGTPNVVEDDSDFLQIIADRRAGERKSTSDAKQQLMDVDTTALQPTRVASMLTAQQRDDSDSDSDIEVVFAKGSKRKYAAFENLPKKKAKETSSHLALRSLAHIKSMKDKKSSMSTAGMGPSLLKAARRQALEERQAKIEKLKAAGVTIQTAEEREQDEEELEDLVERARLEDEVIRKREKELAKKDGTYTKDALDEDDSDEEDGDYEDEKQEEENPGSEDENDESEGDDDGETADDEEEPENELIDAAAEESGEEAESEGEAIAGAATQGKPELSMARTPIPSRTTRHARVIHDDEDDEDSLEPAVESPALPSARQTPHSVVRSTRKVIPGLQHSDDLPLGLTQAFAATMADSQTQQESATQEQDSMDILRDLPSPQIGIMPRMNRLESLDMISESVAGSQTQPLDLNLGISQSQWVPESPARSAQQAPFELTQDAGYSFSPFTGNRFAETPSKGPHSTEETILVPRGDESPVIQRRRLQRGRQVNEDDDVDTTASKSAFQVMSKAAKQKIVEDFNKKKSEARQAVDEAAEESDDEYAGLGGASDEDSGEENEDDRRMIDEDTQVGRGDEAKLAKLHADRERQSDEQAVSKLLKDITSGGLRRKRGAGDDLDLSDEEDAASRRREAKRREFAKMRRELLKDEAVGKIADDQKKQAFLKSIEDHEGEDDDDNDFDQPETPLDVDSQSQSQQQLPAQKVDALASQPSTALKPARESQLNIMPYNARRAKAAASRRPGTLAEIRESVSFLIEEPESQAGIIDLGLSDSEEEPEAYINLDRHVAQAEADEKALEDDNDDLGDFVVDDENKSMDTQDTTFKKPELPSQRGDRAPFAERRTKAVVDRLSMIRQQSSSSAGSNASSKIAFFTGKSAGSFNNVHSLLQRATTNSSLGSMSGRENVSATGVVTNKTEQGGVTKEKEFVRKGANTSRNAINYQARQNLREEKMSARAGVVKKQQKKKGSGFLTGLFRGDTWG
ncbi:hypothetical protein PMZ80_004868 [Knufia obscura]|uniref:DNA replication checkpoint mediator MRC1 domain-containing protein n=1 Tax=Knufia obscura TaxID=1635080 RepID=A0ABR0RPT5_9EURO|nr:hypothetical protein PMZ80_004868 [Knufia obscura]